MGFNRLLGSILAQLVLIVILSSSWSSADKGARPDLIKNINASPEAIRSSWLPFPIIRSLSKDADDIDGQDLLIKPVRCRSKKDCRYAACKRKKMCRNKPKEDKENVCESRECKKTANRMLRNMDKKLKPCTNFYKYACNGFIKRHHVSDSTAKFDQDEFIKDDLRRQYKSILEAPSDGSTSRVLAQARLKYQQCRLLGSQSACVKQATLDQNSMWALSVAYAKNNELSEDTKKKIREIMENIAEAFEKSLEKSAWLDEDTAVIAKRKIDYITKMAFHIGHSEDFFKHSTRPENIENSDLPTAINAEYSYSDNSITVFRAFVNSPYYGLGLDILDYAVFGEAMGHEITHGFDTKGITYNANGEKNEKWFKAAKARFNERVECLINQYSNERITDSKGQARNLNGTLTVNENIADNNGMRLAFSAYKGLKNKKKQKKLIKFERFTDEQLFFLTFASAYCQSEGDAYTENEMISDRYSPTEFRVNVPLSNFDEFAKAWNCPAGSKMNPIHKCRIW